MRYDSPLIGCEWDIVRSLRNADAAISPRVYGQVEDPHPGAGDEDHHRPRVAVTMNTKNELNMMSQTIVGASSFRAVRAVTGVVTP